HDANGKLIAVVYRYDPPGRDKEFRPYDVVARRSQAPTPRPLYNIPGILKADEVILVEGEKAAQALIDHGYAATTAMQGAKAPPDKTGWGPLANKRVLIWPDKERPGWEYAEACAKAALRAGALSLMIVLPPEDNVKGWDAADAVAEGMDIAQFLASAE